MSGVSCGDDGISHRGFVQVAIPLVRSIELRPIDTVFPLRAMGGQEDIVAAQHRVILVITTASTEIQIELSARDAASLLIAYRPGLGSEGRP